MQKMLLIVLTFATIAPLDVLASGKCVTVNDVLESNKPTGSFANTAWNIYYAKDRHYDYRNSGLVFTEEKQRKLKVSVKGYFFWLTDGKPFGCEKIRGSFKKNTGVLVMRTTQVSSSQLSDSTFYKAILSSDGKTLSGLWSGQNTTRGKWKARRLN